MRQDGGAPVRPGTGSEGGRPLPGPREEHGGPEGPHGHQAAVPGRQVGFGFARLMPDVDRPRAWLLTVDGAPQSYVDLDDPEHLEFEYARRLGHILDLAAPPGEALAAVHLGGGALTLPRFLAATRPGSPQEVVEADTELVSFVLEHLPLPSGARIRIHTGDAREALGRFPSAGTDVLLVDVFGGSRVPAHLTSVGFVREAVRLLRPQGLYVANFADGPPLAFARAQAATVKAVLPQVCLIAEAAVMRGRRYGNVVLLASRAELPIAELAGRLAGDPFPARVVHGERLDRFTGETRPVDDAMAQPSPPPPEGTFRIG